MRTVRVDLSDPQEAILQEAAGVVVQGGTLVYPTETLYGIGADARNAGAVARVIRAKRRPDNKPILVIVHEEEMLKHLVRGIPDSAAVLMRAFWPGPLTIVFPAAGGVAAEITQGTGTIGIRIPSSRFCLELLRRCHCPLTSTSANVSGEPAHRTMPEIQKAVTEEIDLYVDGGELPASMPSTVVSVAGPQPVFIREGVIPFYDIQKVVPSIENQ